MKKLLLALFLIICLGGWSQDKDWFISLSTSYMVNGPGYQVKEKMHEQFFNSYVVGFLWDHENPFRGWVPNLMAKGGKKVTSKTMVYALAGLADHGWVRGYRESSIGIAGRQIAHGGTGLITSCPPCFAPDAIYWGAKRGASAGSTLTAQSVNCL